MVLLSVKTTFGSDVRRTTIDTDSTNFAQLSEHLKRVFTIVPYANISLGYLDEDNDQIKITSDLELKEAFNLSQRAGTALHLYLSVANPTDAPVPLSSSPKVTPIVGSPQTPTQRSNSSVPPMVGFEQKMNQNREAANKVLPQFFGVTNPDQAPVDLASSTNNVPQQLFSAFGSLINSVPKEQLTQSVTGLLTNPQVNQMLSQLLISLSALNVAPLSQSNLQTSKITNKPNFVLHEAVCDSCTNRIMGSRYKCIVCQDYDLCETCEAKEGIHDDTHLFLKIKRAISSQALAGILKQAQPQPIPEVKPVPQVVPQPSVLDADLVADVTVPDRTIIVPGTKFVKTWKLHNNGNTKWPAGTRLVVVAGDPIGVKSEITIGDAVEPKQHLDISVECVAPTQPGRYIAYWRLATVEGTHFGCKVWVDIVVEKSAEQLRKLQQEAEEQKRKMEEAAQAEAVRAAVAHAARLLEEKRKKELLEEEQKKKLEEAARAATLAARLLEEEQKKKLEEAARLEAEKREKERIEAEKKKEEERLKAEQDLEEQKKLLAQYQAKKLEEERLKAEQEKAKLQQSQNQPKNKFDEALIQLAEMGFTNKEKNIALLLKHNSDLMKAVQELLNSE